MKSSVEYSNLLSRILLKSSFERQFVIPAHPPKLLERFLIWYERHMMNVDINHTGVDRPIFMIALPRAGASMVQNILCTHPNIAYITNTMHQFRSCFCAAERLRKRFNLNVKGERYLGDSVVVDANTPADGVAFWSQWLKADPYSLVYTERRIEDFSPEEIEKIFQTIRKMIWCFDDPASRFFTKNPGLLPRILLLKDIFHDAKFVHIVRDARMSANSLLKLYRLDNAQLNRIREKGRHGILDDKPFIPYPRFPSLAENVAKYGAEDIRTTAHLWNDAVSFVYLNKEKLPSFYEVRYEDILTNPKEEIFKIFDFLELPKITRDNTNFWGRIGEFGVLRHKNVYENFDVVESICRDNMKMYGYL